MHMCQDFRRRLPRLLPQEVRLHQGKELVHILGVLSGVAIYM